jgi:hypothetical protein
VNLKAFVKAVRDLRAAQTDYMKARNAEFYTASEKNELGLKVAQAATVVDNFLNELNCSSRLPVYVALDSERAYQDAMTASDDRPDMVEIELPGLLLAAEHQLVEARSKWYSGHGPHTATMDCLRKVGGLVVKAGELLGMPQREGFAQ